MASPHAERQIENTGFLNVHSATVAFYPSLYESNQITCLEMRGEGK